MDVGVRKKIFIKCIKCWEYVVMMDLMNKKIQFQKREVKRGQINGRKAFMLYFFKEMIYGCTCGYSQSWSTVYCLR